MTEKQDLRGMIISQSPIGEYDKRIVILTDSIGRISVFARGARRQNSAFMGQTEVFSFGTFTIYPGKSSYTLTGVSVENYFSDIRTDLSKSVLGMYFLEFASYYTREGQNETETLKLIYATLLAMEKGKVPLELIRRIYELRLMTIHGEAMDLTECMECGKEEANMYLSMAERGIHCKDHKKENDIMLDASSLYTLRYVESIPIERLYSFSVSDPVMERFSKIMDGYMRRYLDRPLRSEEMLNILTNS